MQVDSWIPQVTVDRLLAKAQPLLKACIGETKTMRLGPQLTQTGVIVAAEVDSIRAVLPHKAEVVFKITLECGTAKTRVDFRCRKLPV